MAKQTVALYTVTSGDRVSRARESLAEALEGAKLGDADDAGVFELSVDAESPEAARGLVREAFARAGTGDDFVIRESAEEREMPAGDPRQPADRSSRVADAASAVAAAASSAASSEAATAARTAASDAAETVREAASGAAGTVREAASSTASSAREAVDEKGVAGAARESGWQRFAPIGALLFLLWVVTRLRRR